MCRVFFITEFQQSTPSPGPPPLAVPVAVPDFVKIAEEQRKKEQEEAEAAMRAQLLAKQQELLKLEQQRLELELAEARARLAAQALQTEQQQVLIITYKFFKLYSHSCRILNTLEFPDSVQVHVVKLFFLFFFLPFSKNYR